MTKLLLACLLICSLAIPTVASKQEDAAADVVAKAFNKAREAAHLSKLKQMGRNTFGEKVCNHDKRYASGLINSVDYKTSDPAHLPPSAQQLATWPDSSFNAVRFGVGVCLVNGSSGQPEYSITIATYESRWLSFVRIFFD